MVHSSYSRRHFIKSSALVGTATLLSQLPQAHAAGSDKIRIGIIGCGGRGVGSAKNCVYSSDNIEIVAMADLFKDKLDTAYKKLMTSETVSSDWSSSNVWQHTHAVKVPPERRFVGFDAYAKLLALDDVDVVILTGPPHFRPRHLEAAIKAGKHVFMEKPVAVDPVGIRKVIAAAELAKTKGLSIVAGTQRRYQAAYRETMKRIHDGQMGDVVAAQCYWNTSSIAGWGMIERKPEWTDMEWQCRTWFFHTWGCGDHICEQHVHNLDVVNWAIGSPPVSCMGTGGREVRKGPQFGNIYDHFAVEYEYPNGVRVFSMCRQMAGTSSRVSERIVGTEGVADSSGNGFPIKGKRPFTLEGDHPNPYIEEHRVLIDSIRNSRPVNDGVNVAHSTLTAIMGRMSAYTGRQLSWKWVLKASKLDLTPPAYKFGPLETPAVAIPGKTKLV